MTAIVNRVAERGDRPTWFLERLLWAMLWADRMPWAQTGVALSNRDAGWRWEEMKRWRDEGEGERGRERERAKVKERKRESNRERVKEKEKEWKRAKTESEREKENKWTEQASLSSLWSCSSWSCQHVVTCATPLPGQMVETGAARAVEICQNNLLLAGVS